MMLDQRDGDSFVASDGVEYRIGLVNTPEIAECGGAEAASETAAYLSHGFVAHSYATDTHGRSVARISTNEGDLGVHLAFAGYADDRYLEEFRHENPSYAAELDSAFQSARSGRRGLWSSCWRDDGLAERALGNLGHAGHQGTWSCHPAYSECLPVLSDLDCRDVGHQVVLLSRDDPYRLDGTTTIASDGVGCETFPPWADGVHYPYYGMQ